VRIYAKGARSARRHELEIAGLPGRVWRPSGSRSDVPAFSDVAGTFGKFAIVIDGPDPAKMESLVARSPSPNQVVDGGDMLSDTEIASMTRDERAEQSHRLAAFNEGIFRDTDTSQRRRRRIIDLLVATCLGLIPWIVVLGLTLPRRYVANHWTLAWVGFDGALLCALATTAWAAWQRRQVVIIAALVTGTMLVIDAWFDIVTDSTRRDLIVSVVTAVLGELPLAALAFTGAFRLMRLTTYAARSLAGETEHLPLRKVPLLGIDPIEPAGSSEASG
jgi:hypothetical protein